MSPLQRITAFSNWFYWLSRALVILLPLTVLIAIVIGWFDPATLAAKYPELPAGLRVTPVQAGLVALVALLSVLPMMAGFAAMAALFNRYRRGEILSDACATNILQIGRAMIFVALATILLPTLQVLILSWTAPAGQRVLQIGIDGSTLGFLLSGGLMFVIGWVMREAARLREENEGFV